MFLLQVMSQETCHEVSSWQEPWKWRGCREVQRGSCDCHINCDKQSNIDITRIYNHSCRRPMQYCRTQTKSDSTTCTVRGMEGLLSWAPSMLMSLALLAGEQNCYNYIDFWKHFLGCLVPSSAKQAYLSPQRLPRKSWQQLRYIWWINFMLTFNNCVSAPWCRKDKGRRSRVRLT